MIIKEVYDPAIPGYQDLDNDNSVAYSARKTRLTLKQINKLRKMNDIREYEKEAKLKNIRAQYGAAASPDEGSPF